MYHKRARGFFVVTKRKSIRASQTKFGLFKKTTKNRLIKSSISAE